MIPLSTAAASTNVLNVEPGWRRACESRLNWFFGRFGMTAAIARIAPVRGLIEISAAAGSVGLVERRRGWPLSASRW